MASINEIQYLTPSQPRQLRIDTTTNCNAKCPSCHRDYRKGVMNMSLLGKILKDVSKWDKNLEELIPVNYGELFLLKNWHNILTEINQRLPGTQIVIPTNGSMLDFESALKLCGIPNIKVINFSVNAYYDETYINFMGLSPVNIINIRKLIAQIRLLRPDILIRVSMVFDPEYQTDLEKDKFIDYWISFAEPWILPAASADRLSKKPFKQVKIPCRSIFSDIVVGFDGKISSCCFDANFSIDLGMYDGDLLGNWHSKEMNELRKFHNEQKRDNIGICSKCTFA